jgi:hypothetical protein
MPELDRNPGAHDVALLLMPARKSSGMGEQLQGYENKRD